MADDVQPHLEKDIEAWTRIGQWFDVAVSESIVGFRLSEIRRLKDGLLSWSSYKPMTESENRFADLLFAALSREEAEMAAEVEAYKKFNDLDNGSTPQ